MAQGWVISPEHAKLRAPARRRGGSSSSRLQLDVCNLSLGMRHLVNAYEVEAGTV